MAAPETLAWHPPLTAARRLERELGDPTDPATAFSYAHCAELDRTERYPAEISAELVRLGLPRYYVPAAFGGALTSYEEVLHVMRVLARRDLSVAIAHGNTYLGAVGVWIAGTPAQTAALAAEILAGTRVSLGATERDHGSDLLAGEVSAVAVPGGYRLNGEKWPLNNATRGHIVCVLARTDPAGGPRGFDLLLADKRTLAPGSYTCRPKLATHGIRAADISGIEFRDAHLPADALVGAAGGGIETVLKAFQVTRASAAALSLGAADHAFAIAAGYPVGCADLGAAYAMFFVAEALGVLACRAIHTLTDEMSVLSAVTKYLIPSLVDELLSRLAGLLGSGAFLDEQFAKVERDHRIVGIFDGSTFVNQSLIISQFPALVRGYRRNLGSPDGVAGAASLAIPLPPADLSRLILIARTGCSLTNELQATVADLAARPDTPAAVVRDATALLRETNAVHDAMAGIAHAARAIPPDAYALVERYALCVAGAAAVHLWLHNRSAASLWRDATWLRAALAFLLGRLGDRRDRSPEYGRLADAVRADHPTGVGSLLPTEPDTDR